MFHIVVDALRQHPTDRDMQNAGATLLDVMLLERHGTSTCATSRPAGAMPERAHAVGSRAGNGDASQATNAATIGAVPGVFEALVHAARMTTGAGVTPRAAVRVLWLVAAHSTLWVHRSSQCPAVAT